MREYPNVYVVIDFEQDPVAVFYNDTDATKWVLEQLEDNEAYLDEYRIEGPFKVG